MVTDSTIVSRAGGGLIAVFARRAGRRAVELKTLTEARVKETLRDEGIQPPPTTLVGPCKGIASTAR